MQVADVLGTEFKHSLSPTDLAQAPKDIEAALKATKGMRRKIASDLKQGSSTSPAIAEFLASDHARLASAFEAAKRKRRRNRPTLNKVLQVAGELKLDKPLPEIDRVTVKLKKNGDLRFLHDFGPLRRAAQEMVRQVMQQLYVPQPWQYTMRGLPPAIAAAKAELLAGKVYWATLDIKNHYGSFSTKKLANLLPIGKLWVEYVVGGRHAVVEVVTVPLGCIIPISTLLLQALPGLPLGSICSPIIAAHSISRLQWTHNPDWTLLNYADNFLLLASSPQALEKGIDELTSAVGKLPGGNFSLVQQHEGKATDGLEFLGHVLSLTDWKVRVAPGISIEAILQQGMKMGEEVALAVNENNEAKALGHVLAYCEKVKGWLAAFAMCDNHQELRLFFEHSIAMNALPLKINVKELMLGAEANYEFSSDEYQFI
jgi:hypothetical protein